MLVFTQWRIVDSHWVNTLREGIQESSRVSYPCLEGTLADYFFELGIDIPDYVTYCLGQTDFYSFKFRHHGGLIELFVDLIPITLNNNFRFYEQNSTH